MSKNPSLSLAFLLIFAVAGTAYAALSDKDLRVGDILQLAALPLEADPTVKYTASASNTTPIDAVTGDLDAADQTKRVAQFLVVENLGGGNVCVCSTTWALTCAAANCTCTGGSYPKSVVAEGKARSFTYSGTRRVCTATSTSGVEYQVERVARNIANVDAR